MVHMIFLVEIICLNFFLFGEPVGFQCRDCCFDSGVIWETHVSSPVNMAQHAVPFIVIAHQKCEGTSNMLFFVLLCEHLGHPSCTHFPITQMTADNVIE